MLLKTNIPKIQNELFKNGLDALLLISPENRRYATSFQSSSGAVLVTRQKAFFFTDSRYIESAREAALGVEVLLVTREKPMSKLIKEVLSSCGCKALGAEEKTLSFESWRGYEKALETELKPAQRVMERLRAVKEPYEVESVVAAQRIAEKALAQTLPLIKPGVRERDIAAELTYRMLLLGGEGNSFPPICITGAKTSMPHGTPGDNEIQNGDFFMMDFGCVKNGYCSDMTRTVAVGGVSGEMKRVYEVVLCAQLAGIEKVRAGVTGADIHNAGARIIEEAGYGEYFGHGFGHSLGLEIHESPSASPINHEPMPAGAVVTAEPGIYLPGKFGVRIEDMLLITRDGCENLTAAPKELMVL